MRRVIYAILHMAARLVFKLCFDLEVNGCENIPPRGGVIIASNHSSFLDPPVLGLAVYRMAYYMARHDLFSFPIWGRFLRLMNAFPVHRKGFDRKALRQAIEYLRKGEVIILFPEGTRGSGVELLPPMPGVGMIAWEGRGVVIPTYIKGSDKALPPGARFIRFRKIKVTFGKSFSPRELFSLSSPKRELYSRIARYIMSEISSLKQTV